MVYLKRTLPYRSTHHTYPDIAMPPLRILSIASRWMTRPAHLPSPHISVYPRYPERFTTRKAAYARGPVHAADAGPGRWRWRTSLIPLPLRNDCILFCGGVRNSECRPLNTQIPKIVGCVNGSNLLPPTSWHDSTIWLYLFRAGLSVYHARSSWILWVDIFCQSRRAWLSRW